MDRYRRYPRGLRPSYRSQYRKCGHEVIRFPRRFPTPSFLTLLLTNSLSPLNVLLAGGKILHLTSSEIVSSFNLRATAGVNVRILRPARHMGGNDYEHVLDPGLFLSGPSFDLSRFKNGFHSPSGKSRFSSSFLRSGWGSVGDREHGSKKPPRTPVRYTWDWSPT
jgi:hypothetical protein